MLGTVINGAGLNRWFREQYITPNIKGLEIYILEGCVSAGFFKQNWQRKVNPQRSE
jgi:hypothetical protein